MCVGQTCYFSTEFRFFNIEFFYPWGRCKYALRFVDIFVVGGLAAAGKIQQERNYEQCQIEQIFLKDLHGTMGGGEE